MNSDDEFAGINILMQYNLAHFATHKAELVTFEAFTVIVLVTRLSHFYTCGLA